jgi:hypothetical protein
MLKSSKNITFSTRERLMQLIMYLHNFTIEMNLKFELIIREWFYDYKCKGTTISQNGLCTW